MSDEALIVARARDLARVDRELAETEARGMRLRDEREHAKALLVRACEGKEDAS